MPEFSREEVEKILTQKMREFSDELGEILRERQARRDPDFAEQRCHAARCALGALSLARDEIRQLEDGDGEAKT